MTKRAWLLVCGAYALLALGAIITLALLERNTDKIERTNARLIGVTVAYCEIAFLPDDEEAEGLTRLAAVPDNVSLLDTATHSACKTIGTRLLDE
jgi:hypothetical protein